MKIHISAPNCHLRLWLPNGMFLNPVTANVAAFAMRKGMKQASESSEYIPYLALSADQISSLFHAILQSAKDFPDLSLIDVQSSDGTIVKIRL